MNSMVAIRVPFNYDFKRLFELSDKLYVHSFYRPDGKLSFYMVILKNYKNYLYYIICLIKIKT